MRAYIQMIALAIQDYKHEKLLSLCSVCALAAVVAPLLVLYGVKFGIVNTLVERMRHDPVTLEVSPVSSGSYRESDFRAWRKLQDVSFAIPRTRSIAATMSLSTVPKSGEQRKTLNVSIEPTAAGDPLLSRWHARSPVLLDPKPSGTLGKAQESNPPSAGKLSKAQESNPPSADKLSKTQESNPPATEAQGSASAQQKAGDAPLGQGHKKLTLKRNDASLRTCGVVLSESAAKKLGAKEGDELVGKVERSYMGSVSSARVKLVVSSVLPLAAAQKETAFLPLAMLEACEDFRDGRAAPSLGEENGWSGEALPEGPRTYAGFRVYASSLEAVERLRDYFLQNGVDTYTHAEEIARIESLDRALGGIFSLICAIAAAGFFVSTASNVLAAVKRKARTLGLLQLSGFSTGSIAFYPIVQVVLTSLLGMLLASGAYFAIAWCINALLQSSLQDLEQVCRLLPEHFLAGFGLVCGISVLAAVLPSIRGAKVEPSKVIRDV